MAYRKRAGGSRRGSGGMRGKARSYGARGSRSRGGSRKSVRGGGVHTVKLVIEQPGAAGPATALNSKIATPKKSIF